MLSVGIDAHDRLYVMCILDENGRQVKEHTVKGTAGDVAAYLKGLDLPLKVCYEASLGYGVLYDTLKPVASEVKVAHPAHLRAVWAGKKKNDRIDARKLATVLFLDRVPEIHVPSLDAREWRVLIEHRRKLIDKRTAVKNGLRALLRGQGITAPRGSRLWFRAGLAWLRAVEFKSPLTALRRDQLMTELECLCTTVKQAEKMLDSLACKHPGVALLRTIPGVGPRTAEAVVAYVDDPHRFASTRRVASYFGLVPCLDQSAGSVRYGHITREGPATVRKLLTQSSWRAIACSPTLKAFFERVKGGKKDRTGIALIATAHHLAKVMAAMLKSGEEWRERVPEVKKMAA
jgi:transposase